MAHRLGIDIFAVIVLASTSSSAVTAPSMESLALPDVKKTMKRDVTVDDLLRTRTADILTLAPDRRHFAVFVRQADSQSNEYKGGWFIGSIGTNRLAHVGPGGLLRPAARQTGFVIGEIAISDCQWSPDGAWIAYTVADEGGVQLWRSRVDGSVREQLTHNASDVGPFAWADDSRTLYFSVGSPRAVKRTEEERRYRDGYRYDEDLLTFTDFMKPSMPQPADTERSIWVISDSGARERLATDAERAIFEGARMRAHAGTELPDSYLRGAAVSPAAREDGALVWLARMGTVSRALRVTMSTAPRSKSPAIRPCEAQQCVGAIKKVWWSADGAKVIFWRSEGINETGHAIYAWSLASGRVSSILNFADDDLRLCELGLADQLICVRETKTHPAHLVRINLRSRVIDVLVDLNPEFRNIRLGKVERFEWDTPRFDWNEPGGRLAGLYPARAYGYILYPPDFDPTKKYPTFIDPYVAVGFDSSMRSASEHPLHVYAANGFVVLNMAFPLPIEVAARLGASTMKELYSEELDYPHLSMLMESTVRGLDAAVARGFIDAQRVGIGGVSHGTFVPLYMLQKYDRIAAISISSPTWGPHEYYWATKKGRVAGVAAVGKIGADDSWRAKPEGPGQRFWSRIDIADHVDAIEAPILMQLSAQETYALIRLIRHLADAGKPYDAYVFADETHVKWQPAHLRAIMERNLDWFRFWLEAYQDPDPAKSDQYARWQGLKRSRTSAASTSTSD